MFLSEKIKSLELLLFTLLLGCALVVELTRKFREKSRLSTTHFTFNVSGYNAYTLSFTVTNSVSSIATTLVTST